MQPGQPYKQCPTCGQTADIQAPQCPRCGHTFRTQYANPNQTQAFHRMGAEGPKVPYQQPAYYRTGFDLNAFLLSIPPICCFLLGFFVHIIGFVLLVFYFWNPPTRSQQLGWATLWGIIASVVFIIAFACLLMLPAMVIH